MRKYVVLFTLTVSMLAVTSAANAQAFLTLLRGSEEVPPVSTQTIGLFVAVPTDQGAEFTLLVFKGTAVTQAHLHCAPRGENGGIVVFLAGLIEAGLNVNGRWIGNAEFTEANIIPGSACGDTLSALKQAIADGNVYVNVHTVANPAGEIRGQLITLGPPGPP